jgi:hypothetical protein
MVRCQALSENTARDSMPITVNCHAVAHQTHFNPEIALSVCSSQQLCAQVARYSNAFVSIYTQVNTFPAEYPALMLRTNEVPLSNIEIHTRDILTEVSVVNLSPQVTLK